MNGTHDGDGLAFGVGQNQSKRPLLLSGIHVGLLDGVCDGVYVLDEDEAAEEEKETEAARLAVLKGVDELVHDGKPKLDADGLAEEDGETLADPLAVPDALPNADDEDADALADALNVACNRRSGRFARCVNSS